MLMGMIFRSFSIALIVLLSTSCASIIQSTNKKLAASISSGIKNSDDVDIVKRGLPTYIIMLDGMITESPENTALLDAAASLNSLFASQFSSDKNQSQNLMNKAFRYAKRSICIQYEMCNLQTMKIENFQNNLTNIKTDDLPSYYVLSTTWTSWIKENSSDWNAIADLARVKMLLQQVVRISPDYEHGTPYIYLAVLASIVPPALGGQPEIAKQHFETAIAISNGTNLIAKVLFAKHYARMMFDKELHNSLLKEVLQANPHDKNLTLSNILAQNTAKELLENGSEYF